MGKSTPYHWDSNVQGRLERHLQDENFDAPAVAAVASIDWEDLAKRMDALRARLYRETEEYRAALRRRRRASGVDASAPRRFGDCS